MADFSAMSMADRLGEALQRSRTHLEPEAAARVRELINPTSLAIIAGVLIAWVASHAFGVGEAVDLIIGVVGATSIGFAVFTGLDELWEFASDTYRARTEQDLDTAGAHFAKAVTILGIEAVLAMLFRGRPRSGRSKPVAIGPEPPRGPGLRAHPTTTGTMREAAGGGGTDAWGNITYSLRGSARDQALVIAHERIHQILTPKLYPLRRFRVQNRFNSYFHSSLVRYLEEALAETTAQVRVGGGLGAILEGIRFPVENGYVFLRRGGGFARAMTGQGVLTEAAGLIGSGSAAGISFTVWFREAPSAGAARPAQRKGMAR